MPQMIYIAFWCDYGDWAFDTDEETGGWLGFSTEEACQKRIDYLNERDGTYRGSPRWSIEEIEVRNA